MPEKKPRRRFTAAYKLRILQEYESCRQPGEIGALLRREGLYHSNISTWRRQRDQGALQGLSPKKRGRKARKPDPMAEKLARLERENGQLTKKLKQAQAIIEVQKKNLGDPGHSTGKQRRDQMMVAVVSLSDTVGKKAACKALAVPRATFYRHENRKKRPVANENRRPAPPLALSQQERQALLDVAHEERFWDSSPYHIYATLLDEGRYIASVRTIYRVLAAHQEVRERRKQVSRPRYQKPELLATEPNEVWSWDITKLKGPAKWTYFYLYVILDIFSRYVVGWMVAHRESAILAKRLIADTCEKQKIAREQLTLHADRGSSMKSKLVAHLLSDLGVTKTHSRPHVSNDNPYSEAQFKTLKYSPAFPDRFGSIQDARTFCRQFFNWYNSVHKHTSIALMTPEQVHYGLAEEIQAHRAAVLESAFKEHEKRFKGKMPKPLQLPEAAWINKP
ncbi:IS3 family transposase, partial [Desulfovulcanus sp.]